MPVFDESSQGIFSLSHVHCVVNLILGTVVSGKKGYILFLEYSQQGIIAVSVNCDAMSVYFMDQKRLCLLNDTRKPCSNCLAKTISLRLL
jgi:hypothetical protein